MALGALFIKQRLGLSDDDTVEKIKENASMQFSLGYGGYACKPPCDPLMKSGCGTRWKDVLDQGRESILWVGSLLGCPKAQTA